jgi:thiol-disulfide isomerase/thioredoxin
MGNTAYTGARGDTGSRRQAYRYRPAQQVQGHEIDDAEEIEEQASSTRGRALALGGAVVMLMAVFSVVVWLLSTRTPATPKVDTSKLPEGPVVGERAPKFSLFNVRTNQEVSLASLQGKPVFLNFWATWCPPCKAEMPEIERLYNTHKGDVAIIGVSMGPRDEPAGVKNFVDAASYSWSFIHDSNYDVATRYNVMSIPSSFFIDKDGVVRVVHVGMMDGNMMENYIQKAKQSQ